MDTLSPLQTSVESAAPTKPEPEWRVQARLLEQRCLERFGGTFLSKERFETRLTPEQVARVERLMDVPYHLLGLDDSLDRETLACQRMKRDLALTPLYRGKDRAGSWAYWSGYFGSGVNSLRR